MARVRKYAPWALIIIILTLWAYSWYEKPNLVDKFHGANPWSTEISTEVKECTPVVHYVKTDVIREVSVPAHVEDDSNKEVTAIGVAPRHEGETTIIATLDTVTGITALDIRQERPSLFELPNRKAIGLRCDVTNACEEITLYGAWEFLRVGAIHLEGYAEITSDNTAYAGVGLEYRF
jgi:hypothetical protein